MGHPTIEPRRCKAKSARTGKPCAKYAIRGGTVCDTHGGKAPQVRAAANERLADLIDPNRVLRETARLAYSDVRDIFDEHGNLRPVKEWPDNLSAAIASVEVVERNLHSNDGAVDQIHKVKFWDKTRAVQMLMQHLGLLVEKLEVSGNVNITERLAAGRKRVAEAKRV